LRCPRYPKHLKTDKTTDKWDCPLGNMDLRSNTYTGWFASDGMRFGTHRTGTSICCFRLCLLRRWLIHLLYPIQDVDRQPVRNESLEGHEHFTLVFPVCYSRTRRFANKDETEVHCKTLSFSQSPPNLLCGTFPQERLTGNKALFSFSYTLCYQPLLSVV